ncbi:hypothetical protein GIB67_000517 [Kingdonia uniflora]|uniref:Uncharacterized protein n=1 Tax=Kingdonia uniflora TaxID=39325 RepID=A0A7J7MIA2_9MAGN|nr:hypothetical protein GIB67_000517 [Kingdonia uniflora]
MVSSPASEASTSGRSTDSEIKISKIEEEIGIDQFPDIPGRLVSYPPRSDVFKEFYKAKDLIGGRWGSCIEHADREFRDCTAATGEEYFYLLANLAKEKRDRGRPWNDNVIWVKGDCVQRDDEEPMELLFKNVKHTPKSQLARKVSLLDTVTQVKTELEVVLEDLGISRKKRVNSRVEKVQNSQLTRLITSTDDSKKKGTNGERTMRSGVASKKRRVEPSERSGMKAAVDRSVVEYDLKEVKEKARLATLHGEEKMSKMESAELKKKKVELERILARLKTNLLKEGKWVKALNDSYSEDEVDVIKADTYVEEEVDVAIGVVDRLDGVSPLMEFDRIREANKDKEDQHVKVHFKFVEVTQTAVDLAQKIEEEKDAEIEKGQKELVELKEHVAKLKSQNNVLMVKSREADMARYRIQALKGSEEGLNRSMAGLKNYLIKTNNNHEQTRADLANSRSELERLKMKFVDKDNELKRGQDHLSASEVAVDQLTTSLPAKEFKFWTVADLEAINRAESAKANKKLEENIAFTDWVVREMIWLKERALLSSVARSEYFTSTAATAAGGSFTSTKTSHNPLKEFFELDRNQKDENPIVYVLDVLAVVVSQVLGSPIFLPIGSLLFGPEVSEKGIFGALKLESYRSETGNRDGLAGKEFLPQDALQVQFHPLRPFYRGEIVAWKTGNDGDKLTYVRVLGDVFSFRNIATANESSLSTFPNEGKTKMGNRKLVQVLESAGSVKSSSSKWYQICTVKRIKLEVQKPEVRSCNKNS